MCVGTSVCGDALAAASRSADVASPTITSGANVPPGYRIASLFA